MPQRKKAKEKQEKTLDAGSQKGRRGPHRRVLPSEVRQRADNYRDLLEKVWDELWPTLSQARSEGDVIRAFKEKYPFDRDFMPHLAAVVLEVLKEPKFPKRGTTRIKFMADSLAGLGRVSPRRSRDICDEDRAEMKRAHQIIRCEFYVECSCGYKGRSSDKACRRCSAAIPPWLIPVGINLG